MPFYFEILENIPFLIGKLRKISFVLLFFLKDDVQLEEESWGYVVPTRDHCSLPKAMSRGSLPGKKIQLGVLRSPEQKTLFMLQI
jgi:hypothetical protein